MRARLFFNSISCNKYNIIVRYIISIMEYVNKHENTVLLWKLFSGRPTVVVMKSRNENPPIPDQINIVRFYQFTPQSRYFSMRPHACKGIVTFIRAGNERAIKFSRSILPRGGQRIPISPKFRIRKHYTRDTLHSSCNIILVISSIRIAFIL